MARKLLQRRAIDEMRREKKEGFVVRDFELVKFKLIDDIDRSNNRLGKKERIRRRAKPKANCLTG